MGKWTNSLIFGIKFEGRGSPLQPEDIIPGYRLSQIHSPSDEISLTSSHPQICARLVLDCSIAVMEMLWPSAELDTDSCKYLHSLQLICLRN